MPSEVEIKLLPFAPQDEGRIRQRAEKAFQIRQRYLAACGPKSPTCLKILRNGKDAFLEISSSDKKKGRCLLFKISKTALRRLQSNKSVLRVRKSEQILGEDVGDVRYFLTVKEDSSRLGRAEWEHEIPRWAFAALWKAGKKESRRFRAVRKRRYYIREANQLIHVDFFLGRLKGFTLIEVEFPRVQTAKAFRKLRGQDRIGGRCFVNFPKCIQGGTFEVTQSKKAGNRFLAKVRKRPCFDFPMTTISEDSQPR